MYDKPKFEIGDQVQHLMHPEWGTGEIIALSDGHYHIYFNGRERTEPYSVSDESIVKECDDWTGSSCYKKNSKTETDRNDISYESQKLEANKSFQEIKNYFCRYPRLYNITELESTTVIPTVSGVYAWYFKSPPPVVSAEGCIQFKEEGFWKPTWKLLYIGEGRNLRSRVRDYHIKESHYAKGTMSSFRLHLGCLLWPELGLMLKSNPQTFGKDKFNKWMEKNTRVAWWQTPYHKEVERYLIRRFVLPLNIRDNDEHPFSGKLSALSSCFETASKSSKPRKKDFKKAYKEFVKSCESSTYKHKLELFIKSRR